MAAYPPYAGGQASDPTVDRLVEIVEKLAAERGQERRARGAVDPRRPRGATGGRGSLASASLEAAAAQPRRRIGHLGCCYEPHGGWGCVRRPCAAANGFLEWLLCFRVLFEPEEMWECYLFSLGASKKWL